MTYCGNEGQPDDPTLAVSLRTILQTIITKLDTESAEIWKNAEIVIYDKRGNDYCIRSGDMENKFVVQLDENNEIHITCTHREKGPIALFLAWILDLDFTTILSNPTSLSRTLAIEH